MKGVALGNLGLDEEALVAFGHLVDLAPTDLAAARNYAGLLLQFARIRRGRAGVHAHVLDLEPSDTTALASRGRILLALDDAVKARECLTKAVDLDANDAVLRRRLGLILHEMADYLGAISRVPPLP